MLNIQTDLFQFRLIVTVEDAAVDQIRDDGHLGFFHAAGGDRRSADTDTAGNRRRFRVKRDQILVDRDLHAV